MTTRSSAKDRLPRRRIVSFGLLPVLAGVAPVLVLPVIAARLEKEGWAAIAVGQSVGLVGAILVAFAWPVLGPAAVAGRTSDLQWRELWRSLRVRSALFLLVIVPAWAIAAALSPGPFSDAAGLTAVAFCAYGLASGWFFIGTGQAGGVAAFEAVPRLVGTMAAIPILWFTANPLAYPACILVGSLAGSIGAAWRVSRRTKRSSEDELPKQGASRSLQHLSLTLSGLVTSGYTVGSTAIVSALAPNVWVIAAFAGVFRIQAMARIPAQTIAGALQGWVSEGGTPAKRMRLALAAMVGIGAVVGLSVAVLLPLTLDILFLGSVSATPLASALCGLLVFAHATSLSASVHVLVPAGRVHLISLATVLGSCLGVPLLLWLTPRFGVEGAVVSLLAAEALVVAIELPAALQVISGLFSRQGADDR